MNAHLAKILLSACLVGTSASCISNNETSKNDFTVPSTTPLISKFYQKDDGSLVKDEGWLIPAFHAKDKQNSFENVR